MTNNYINELDAKNEQKINEILEELPPFCKSYFRHLRLKNRSSLTRLQYAMDIKGFFSWISNQYGFKDKYPNIVASDLEVLSREDFYDYLDSVTMYDKRLAHDSAAFKAAPETIARKVSSLRSFFNYYQKDGTIQTNLTNILESPKRPEHKIITLDDNEIERLLLAIRDTDGMNGHEYNKHIKTEKRDLAIITLFLSTGIRISELVGIDVQDVDFYNARITVHRKGNREEYVYLNETCEAYLTDYLDNARDDLNPVDNALFVSLQHKRVSADAIQLMLKKYGTKAGIAPEKLTPHKLRKTFGTNLYLKSGDLLLTSESLGHHNIDTTRKHYVASTDEHRRTAAGIVEDLIKK